MGQVVEGSALCSQHVISITFVSWFNLNVRICALLPVLYMHCAAVSWYTNTVEIVIISVLGPVQNLQRGYWQFLIGIGL